jgi:hypothetical protein
MERDSRMKKKSQSVNASRKMRKRVADLIEREREEGISEVEKAELDQYFQLEHQMRLIVAKTRDYLADEK